jgi:hypothetical protein
MGRRLRKVCALIAVWVFWASLTFAGSARGAVTTDQTEARITTALTGLQRFRSSHSIDDLKATSYALFSAVDLREIQAKDLVTRRRSVVTAYAQVLRQIESLSDPAFNPNELPTLCVSPPREPDGRQLPACADPKEISDPATRAAYVTALDANSANIRRRNAQARLYVLADETTSVLELVLRRFHSRAQPDATALDDILRRAGVSDIRRAKIDAAV